MSALEWLLIPFGAAYRLALWFPLLAYGVWWVLVRVCRVSSARERFWSLLALMLLQPLLFLTPLLEALLLGARDMSERLVSVPPGWDPATVHLTGWQTLALIWPYLLIPLGMLGAALLGGAEYLYAAWHLRRTPRTRVGRVLVLERPDLLACTFGLLRPTVLVSRAVWEGEHREAVLAHEREHARRRDPLLLFLARGIRRSTLYLPFGGQMLADLILESERACDAAGVRAVGVKAYAGALLSFATAPRPRPVPTAPAFGWPEALGLLALLPPLQWWLSRVGAHLLSVRLEALLRPQTARQRPLLFWLGFGLLYLLLIALT